MEGSDPIDSPLDALVDATGADVVSAFKQLGNETRLAILLALWEAIDLWPADGPYPVERRPLSFSALRERVDVADSGRFNYHLGELEGHYIEAVEDGYRLLRPGIQVVQTVIGGAGFETSHLEPTPVDIPCPVCGGTTEVAYRDHVAFHVCPSCEGLITGEGDHPPGGLIGAVATNATVLRRDSPEEILAATMAAAVLESNVRGAGICPRCSGPVEARLHVCDDHEADGGEPCETCGRAYDPAVLSVCSVCKNPGRQAVTGFAYSHPSVWAFYWRHGVDESGGFDLQALAYEAVLQRKVEEEMVSHTPPRVRLTFSDGGHELRLTYDEDMDVVELTESG